VPVLVVGKIPKIPQTFFDTGTMPYFEGFAPKAFAFAMVQGDRPA
jgi:hypothetical protein